jgi:hypothetical protein
MSAERGVVAWVRGEQALVCDGLCQHLAHHLETMRPVVLSGLRYSPQAASRRLGTCVWCAVVLRDGDARIEPMSEN